MRTGYDDGVGRLRVVDVVSPTEADTILASWRATLENLGDRFAMAEGTYRCPMPGAGLVRHDDETGLTGPVGCAFVINGHALHSGARNDSSSPRPTLQFVFPVTDRSEDS